MIQIQFLDKHGKEINPGDWLKIYSNSFGRTFSIFYVQFQIKEDYIIPHDNFSWESIEKINFEDIPKDACSSGEGDYYYQYEKEEGDDSGQHLHFVIGLGDLRNRTKSYIIKEVLSTTGKPDLNNQ